MRDPICFGGPVGFVGTVTVIGDVRGALAIIFVLAAFLRKSRMEEAFLSGRFGSSYLHDRNKVESLVPIVD